MFPKRNRHRSHRNSRDDRRYSDASSALQSDGSTPISNPASTSVEETSLTSATSVSWDSEDLGPGHSLDGPQAPLSFTQSPQPTPTVHFGSRQAAGIPADPYQEDHETIGPEAASNNGYDAVEDLAASLVVFPGSLESFGPLSPSKNKGARPKATKTAEPKPTHGKKKRSLRQEPLGPPPWEMNEGNGYLTQDAMSEAYQIYRPSFLPIADPHEHQAAFLYPTFIANDDLYDRGDRENDDWDMCEE